MHNLLHDGSFIGIDEAGRGPLAGPVVAAAVCLPEDFDVAGLNDSKQLSADERAILESRIRTNSIFAIAIVDAQEIDRINILAATMKAMFLALSELDLVDKKVLIDGNCCPGELRGIARCEVKGDGRFACIAAASILAKTERDRMMCDAASCYPGYGFERHFGYGTPEHLSALRDLGPCALHRMSFAPVATAAYQMSLF